MILAPLARKAIIALAVVAIVLLLGVSYCSAIKGQREAKNDAATSTARTTSAVEAIKEIGKLRDAGQATDKQVEHAIQDIRQADPADRDRVARERLVCLQNRDAC